MIGLASSCHPRRLAHFFSMRMLPNIRFPSENSAMEELYCSQETGRISIGFTMISVDGWILKWKDIDLVEIEFV